jgi:hypothetical protein
MANGVFQGEMDPEIAALLGAEAQPKTGGSTPDFAHLFNDNDPAEAAEAAEAEELDLNSAGFPAISKFLGRFG